MTATARNGAAPHRRLAPAVRTACLLLALACLAPPLAAQAADPILISNQSKTVRANPYVGTSSYAQQFRTGSASGVYSISDVILTFSKGADRGTTTVTVRSDSSGNPADAALATMTLDSAGMGNIAFTPSSPVRLEPQTRYWVVAQHSTTGTSGPRWARVLIADGLDADSAAGWEIDQTYQERRAGPWTAPQNMTQAMKIRLRGTVIPAVTVASDGDVTEGTAASFTLTRTGDTAAALEVGVTVSETGDMVAAGDEGTRTVTFGAGSATSTVTVPTQADSDSESDSTVTVAVADGDGYVAGTPSQAGVVVADDDDPVVTITSGGNVTEGAAARFNLTRTGNRAAALTVEVTVSETGGMVASGDEGTRTVRFSAGSAIFQLAVATQADSTHEPDSTVTVTVVDGSDYDPGTPSQADVVVSDDDNAAPTGAPTIDDTTPLVGETLTADASGISDADGLTGATFTWQWLRVSGSTETRIPGATAATYTVVAADEGATLKVEATFTDDDGTEETVESAETSTVEVPPMLSIGDPSVNEGDTGFANLVFTVTLDPTSGNEVSVWYADFENGTATRGTDYLSVSSAELTFAPGESEKRITVRVRGDRIDEEDETIEIGLGTPTGAEISRATGTGTIRDDDEATLAIDSPRAEEADAGATSTLTFTVTLDPVSDRRVTVAYADSASGTATSGTDYEAVAGGTLTFAPGESEKTVTVTVTGDDVGEGNETVGIALSGATGGATIGTASGTGTIVDNDVPQFSIDSPRVDEGDSGTANLTFTVTLDPASSGRTTVAYADSGGGTATSGTDYAAVAGGTLTFAPGDITKTVTVAVRGDGIDEPDETVEIALSGATGGADIATPAGTGTIADDDDEPTVTLVLSSNSITEVNRQSTVTATLDHASSEETTVTVSVAPVAPAVAGDYTLSSNRVLTIAAGSTTSTGTVTVTSVNNVVDAPDKTVTVSGTATNSQGVTAPAPVTLTIRDNDAEPTVTLVLTPASITEAGGTSTVTATLNHPSSEATTVTVSASPVSPAVSGDYTLSGNLDLTIAAGATTSTGTVTITAVDNDVHGGKTVTVSGAATNSQGITAPQSVTLTITDDEAPPGLSIADASVDEGDSGSTTLAFTVTLNPVAASPVTVDWATADGTARAGTDYTAGNGSLTFNAGDSTKTVSVSVTGDDVDEPDKTFTVTLSSASGATIGDAEAIGTIRDDDDEPTVTLVLTPDSIDENGGTSTVTARLNHPSSEATTVTVSVAPVSPAVSGDYRLSTNRVLTIAAGATTSTGTVTVTSVNNTVDAPDKTVTVSGTATNSQGVTDPAPVTLTITDDEVAMVTVAAETGTVPEGDDAVFILTRTGVVSDELAVTFEVTGGDTVLTNKPPPTGVTFQANEDTARVTLATEDDDTDEPDAMLTLTLDDGAAYDPGTPSRAVVTVQDDEDPPMVRISSADDGSTKPEGDDVVFVVELTRQSAVPVTVKYTLTRTAVMAGDGDDAGGGATGMTTSLALGAIEGDVTFAPGEMSKEVTLGTDDDRYSPTGDTLEITLQDGEGYVLDTSSPSSRTVTVTVDNDDEEAPMVSIADAEPVTEGDPLVFAVTLNRASAVEITVDYALEVTPEAEDNHEGPVTGTVTFEPDDTVREISVKTVNDGIVEPGGMVKVTLSSRRPPEVMLDRSVAMGTILDDVQVSVLAEGLRAGAGALLRRHVQRFSQLTSDVALGRLAGGDRASTVDVDVGDGGVSANGDVAMALPSGWDGWASVRYSKLNGSADGSVWDVYAGADRLGADGRTAYGALLGYEPGRVTAEGVRLEAEHVQLGLYGAHRLSETLTVDGALGWGRGKGDLSLVEGAPVTASYRSERIAVRGDLTGDFGWGGEGLRVEPQIGLLYAEEGLDAFTDSMGSEAPEERLWLARLGLGPKVTWNLGEGGTMHGKLRVNLDAHNLESDEGRTEEVSASLELGHRWRIDKGSSLDLSVDFDGLGSGWFSSGTVGLRYEARF